MRYLLAFALVAGCGSHTPEPTKGGPIDVGATAPDALLAGTTGAKVALADSWTGHKHAVVVFYRGFY